MQERACTNIARKLHYLFLLQWR